MESGINEIMMTLKDHFETIKELAAKVNRNNDKVQYAEEWIHTTQESFAEIFKPIQQRLERLETNMAMVLVDMPDYPSGWERRQASYT